MDTKNIQRELEVVAKKVNCGKDSLHIKQLVDSVVPVSVLSIELQSEHATEVFTGFA